MRYLPLTDDDRREMLAAIGAATIEELFDDVPSSARLSQPLDLPAHTGELEVERAVTAMATKNLDATIAPFFLGAGIYRHHIPAAADHLIQRGEFLTAYTPYQPEISQGTLQAVFEFQTQVALVTGMEVANASLYDGATACAEAAMMACRVTRRNKVVLSGALHPHYAAVTRTNAKYLDIQIDATPVNPVGPDDLATRIGDDVACVIVQNPDFFGRVRDFSALAQACHDEGALLVVVVSEIISLGMVMPPGDMGADIVAAEGQSLGNAMNFGGPHVGLFSVRERYLRQMPGRLAGETVDVDGRRGWVLTLSTRATNSGLCALAFSVHLSLLGDAGFTGLARLNHAKAIQLADRLAGVAGVELLNDTFFNEFTVRLSKPAAGVVEELAGDGILAGVPVSRLLPEEPGAADLLLVAATETASDEDMDRLAAGLAGVL